MSAIAFCVPGRPVTWQRGVRGIRFDARGKAADCAAIYAVAVHGGERTGMAWHRWLGVYARRFARREVRRQWVYRLDRAASDPRAGIGWRAYRPRWLAILAAADAAVAGPATCEATDWGSVRDFERRRAQGRRFRRVVCGQTRGIYAVRGER